MLELQLYFYFSLWRRDPEEVHPRERRMQGITHAHERFFEALKLQFLITLIYLKSAIRSHSFCADNVITINDNNWIVPTFKYLK